MPGIYEVTCTRCSLAAKTSASSTWVALRDGTQELCPHPGERSIAEGRTGEPWHALVRAGRLRYRHALVCRACGAVEHYELPTSERGGHIASIVRQPRANEAQDVPCTKCGARRLTPIVGPPLGRLVSVPLTAAVVAALGAIGACGKAAVDRALEGQGTGWGIAAALAGIAIGAGMLARLAYRRDALRAAIACPVCRTGALQVRMVAIS